MELDKYVYIMELKLDSSAEIALNRIKDKGYADKFKSTGKTIHLLGINFSTKDRNISEWKEELINK